ncbi:MAG: hypothetical protein ACYC9Y_00620 [Candidatus Methylomirabilia bacterium]
MARRLTEMVLQEKDRAKKATLIAIGLWMGLSAALAGLILLLRKG